METSAKKGLNISARSFIIALAVIFALMILAYLITLVIPGGEYARIADESGNMIVDTSSEFKNVEGNLSFWQWLFSPFLVLTVDGSATIIAVIIFLLVIGGVFNLLEKSGLMRYMLDLITFKYKSRRYKLMAVMMLAFMAMGALVGSFEEVVPLVPIVVALAVSLGWDPLTGVAMSLLATGCGFSTGVCNPFTVGVAQELVGLPMFSGIWLRLLAFICIYFLLLWFVRTYAKKVERDDAEELDGSFEYNDNLGKALKIFVIAILCGIVLVLLSPFITVLQDFTLIIFALAFLVGGVASALCAGLKGKAFAKVFWDGMVSLLPAVVMILMASSIKYILEQSHRLDTIIHAAVGIAGTMPKWAVILFIYLIVLIMNFFIASGSAKAFMLIPLIVPIARVFSIPAQLCIVAYAFGDGFSNVFYPTNPALLISLGVSDISYSKWAKFSLKFQLLNLVLTSLILLLGLAVGYGA